MSIVEKALGKLREQDAGTTVTTRSAIGAAARRGFEPQDMGQARLGEVAVDEQHCAVTFLRNDQREVE